MALDPQTAITWYGHACVEVVTPGGKTILFDPWFGNPMSPKPADQVTPCDLLLVTHGHSDHFGEALSIASRLQPDWPCIHEMSLWVGRRMSRGADAVVGMNKGGRCMFGELEVAMTPADHSAGDWNAAAETTLYLGEPAGFVVRLENGLHDLPRRRHERLRRHGAHPRAPPAEPRLPADRRPLHDGPPGGGAGGRAARRVGRGADPLGHVPDPGRHAGRAAGGARHARAGRCHGPRLGAGRHAEGRSSGSQRPQPTDAGPAAAAAAAWARPVPSRATQSFLLRGGPTTSSRRRRCVPRTDRDGRGPLRPLRAPRSRKDGVPRDGGAAR